MYILYISVLICSFCGIALSKQDLYKLDIIHYNDFHSRFEETSLANSICRTNNNLCLGGFPRLYHHVTQLLAQKPDAILLNAGDNFQGTYWYTAFKGSFTAQFLNMLPHDAYAIGNHEFEDGPVKLAEFLSKLKAPVLVANMDTSKEPLLQGKYRPSVVVERKGRKIGIIGLITEDTKVFLDIGKVVFTNAGDALRREALALRGKGVDIIIVLSHCGLEVDNQFAKDHGEYIDVIVGGHSHSLLWNGRAPTGEPVAGPYPLVVAGHDNNEVLIVQTSAVTKYMGNLSVYFDNKGNYVKHEGDAILLDRSIPEDLNIKKMLEPYLVQVHRAEQEVVGDNLSAMSYEDCAFGECALGDLLTDSMVDYAKTYINSTLEYLAFNQRYRYIKANFEKGNITKGVVFELLPYSYVIQHFEIKGKLIREALEKSVSDATSFSPFTGPWVLQVSGLQVRYNVALPEGKRLTSVFVGGKGSTTLLQDDVTYHVLGPNFWHGYPMFSHKHNPQDIGIDHDILETYIKRHSPLDKQTDGRIVISHH